MSVVQSPGKLLKLLTHSEGDGVVSEDAASFDDVLVCLLLDHLPQLQLQSNLSHVRANTWRCSKVFYLNAQSTNLVDKLAHRLQTHTLLHTIPYRL